MHDIAAQWIVELLRERNIAFLICGGLAAQGYGSERELNDIDLFVPGEHFWSVVEAGQEHVFKAAAHRQEEGWDITYVQFKYAGIKVEVGSADASRIFDARNGTWMPLKLDFSRFATVRLLGLELPLMLADDLVEYKSALSREVDLEDILAIRGRA